MKRSLIPKRRRGLPQTCVHLLFAAVLVASAFAGNAYAQIVPAPNADQDAMYLHFHKAMQIAGMDLYPHFAHACIIDQHYRRTISRGIQMTADLPPAKVMDHLYFVGQNGVSAWIIETSAGLVEIDSLNNPEEAKKWVLGGMEKLGLKQSDLKYILITHAHGDHFGGAKYLHEVTGARLACSQIDWDAMQKLKTAPPRENPMGGTPPDWGKLVPDRDIVLADGQKWVVGDTTINCYITPGHTDGLISVIFKATDHGQPHVVAQFGAMGMPGTVEDKRILAASMARFKKIALEMKVDTLISSHQTRDRSVEKIEINRLRRGNDPNPFVVGVQGYQRYLDINIECIQYAAAREGQKY